MRTWIKAWQNHAVVALISLHVIAFPLIDGSHDLAAALLPRDLSQPAHWYRFVTVSFVHAGVVHLSINMIPLAVWGRQVESLLGSLRFLVLFWASVALGSTVSYLVAVTDQPTGGASAGVFGVLAVASAVQPLRRGAALLSWSAEALKSA